MKFTPKWIVWDGDRDHVFEFASSKEARAKCKIYNKERSEWQPMNHVFKRVT